MISLAVQIRESKPDHVTIRRWREIWRGIWQQIGDKWKDENLKDHFTEQAAQKYGYQPRTLRYRANKVKRFIKGKGFPEARALGPIDLVYSGRMYRTVTKGAVVQTYPSRATIKMPGPEYISGTKDGSAGRGMRVNRGGYIDRKTGKMRVANKRPNMGREILKDTPQQVLEIGVEIDRLLTEALNAETVTTVEDM